MKQTECSWASIEGAIPSNHRYRLLRKRLQPLLGTLELRDGHMLWMMVLQICDGLSEAKLLKQLPENFCMRWLCGYGLADEIVDAASYSEYKQSISAYRLVRLVKTVLEPELNGEAFMSALNLLLDEGAAGAPGKDGDRLFFALISKRDERLVELIEGEPELELAYARCEGMLQQLAVLGSETQVRAVLDSVPQLAVGVASGREWELTFASARSAFEDQQVNGRVGCLFNSGDDNIRIVNLMLADKRLALENFLKESRLEQAYSLFEDMVGMLSKRAKELHWLQIRHELLKIYCALYNGGFHYQHSPLFFSNYISQLELLTHCSFEEAVESMRSLLHSFEIQQFQEVIAIGFSDYAAAARDMIEKHYATDLTLGDMARHFGITPEYLSSSFRKSEGRNFVEYLTDVRIKHACRLLSYGGVKVNEVAHMVGFANADYFGKVFKQKMHLTPRQYQKSKT